MSIFILVATAFAATRTETFGGDDDWDFMDSSTVRADCFSIETTTTLTEVQVYAKRALGASAETSIAYWKYQSYEDWDNVDSVLVDEPSLDGDWVSTGEVSWRLSAGESYCIGLFAEAKETTYARTGDEYEDVDPTFGVRHGSCGVYLSSVGNSLYCSPEEGQAVRYYLKLSFETTDRDEDGFDSTDDCDDRDETVNPDTEEIWYDGVDQNCDGNDGDQDEDGYDAEEAGGDDCDDEDGSISPARRETWYDGIDQNCDGNDGDQDEDGYDAEEVGGRDCDDEDARQHPGAEDTPYDNYDQDCSGSDYDADGDGYDSAEYGGKDCDDTNDAVSPGAEEVWYDGVDQDCDGANDFDADGDGYAVSGDCNDLNPAAWREGDTVCSITPAAGDGCDGCGGSDKGAALLAGAFGLALGRRRRAREDRRAAGQRPPPAP